MHVFFPKCTVVFFFIYQILYIGVPVSQNVRFEINAILKMIVGKSSSHMRLLPQIVF